jgi:hypothetical protein
MAKSPAEKKRKPPAVDDTKIFPTELQVGDRLADKTGEWQVIAVPYSTAGGRMIHTRVQRIGEPASWQIRSWDASKRIGVRRASSEEGKG